MIQELLGGNCVVGEERKNFSTASPTSSSITAAAPRATVPTRAAANTSTNSSNLENLRCPRCDSANTKFCYYNNYNLTQPRHFCKTCRRYWTKGGALRNVPIGGGCRKNKPGVASSNSAAKSSSKTRNMAPESGRFSFEQELLQPHPILWAPTQNSPLLTLLRTATQQSPNPNMLLSNHVKEEPFGIGHMVIGPTCSRIGRTVGSSDPLGPAHIDFDLSRSGPRNEFFFREVPNELGSQELYHRLKLSADYGSTSSPSAVQGPAPAAGGDPGYWNNNIPAFCWSDLQTINGAHPY